MKHVLDKGASSYARMHMYEASSWCADTAVKSDRTGSKTTRIPITELTDSICFATEALKRLATIAGNETDGIRVVRARRGRFGLAPEKMIKVLQYMDM